MGYNTTVVVINDALGDIESDPNFGKNLAAAIREAAGAASGTRIDVPAKNHANAAHVVESHHADETALVTVGGNLGLLQLRRHGWNHHTREGQVEVLKAWANRLGYELTPVKH